jgi:regulatory protein
VVVQFPPAGSTPRDGGRRRAGPTTPEGGSRSAAPSTGALAPVTYLPGANPSEESRRALAAVVATPRDDEEAPARDRRATRAGNVAIHQLARRGLSRWELEQVLAKREVEGEVATAELDRLVSIGLVDDAALAVSIVYALHTRKGAGRAAIEQELRRRHLPDEVISDAMAEVDDADEQGRADELAEARARQLMGLDFEVAARRLSGYLARKGYDGTVVRAAVRHALEHHPRGPGSAVRFR